MGDMNGEPLYCPYCGTLPGAIEDPRRICRSCGASMKDLTVIAASALPDADLTMVVARAIRRAQWAYWGRHVPDGDETLASLGDAAVEGYHAQAEAALAAVEAAGWRPPASPLTGAEVDALARAVQSAVRKEVTQTVMRQDVLAALAVLRHPLLAARGVTVEGEQG